MFGGPGLDYGAVCTHGFQGPWSDLEILADILVEFHRKLITDATTIVRVDFKQGPSDTGPSTSSPAGVVGTVGGFPGLANASILITKLGLNISGRRYGRVFSPAAPTAWVTADGELTSGARGAIVNACQDLNDILDTSGWAPVIFNGSSDPTAMIGYAQTQTRAATQRRRMRR